MSITSTNYKATITEWDRRVSRSVECHYESAKELRSRHYLLGIPAIIIVTFMGTLKDINFNNEMNEWSTALYHVICIIAAIAAVLVGLQTFLNFSQRAEKHREAASEYGSVRREIEHLDKKKFEKEEDLEEAIRNIRTKLDTLSKTTPEVPSSIWDKVRPKYQSDKFKSKLE
jgi:hypothetical protein